MPLKAYCVVVRRVGRRSKLVDRGVNRLADTSEAWKFELKRVVKEPRIFPKTDYRSRVLLTKKLLKTNLLKLSKLISMGYGWFPKGITISQDPNSSP